MGLFYPVSLKDLLAYNCYMGKIENLEKELYDGAEKELSKRMNKRVLFPSSLKKVATVWSEKPTADFIRRGEKSKNWLNPKVILGGAAVVMILLGSAFLFFYLSTKGQEASIAIGERDIIEAGEIVTIPFTYRNESNTKLQNVELVIMLPKDAILVDSSQERPAPPRISKKISDLEPGQEGRIQILARFFGYEGEKKDIEAVLVYRPESLGAQFSTKTSRALTINRVPLSLHMEIPEAVVHGQEIEGVIRYSSDASRPFQNIWLRLEYPSGFAFVSADPKPQEGNTIWKIGDIQGGAGGIIKFKGIITGPEREVKSFRAELGVLNSSREWQSYRETSFATKIAVAPLSLQAFHIGKRSGVVNPGERLGFMLSYKNNTLSVLKNVSVRAYLEGDTLDFSTLQVDEGVFDFNARSIVWTPGNAPELRELDPGETGSFNFSIEIKARPVYRGASDKNQLVRLRTEIQPSATPQELAGTNLFYRDSIEFKVKSKILFTGKSIYNSSPIPNSGPIPPKIGSETTYTIMWELRNFTSDLDGVEVRAPIPPNVLWKNIILPGDANVNFDAASGEVKWRVGKVEAGTGIIIPAKTLAFSVGIIPSEADENKSVILLGETILSATEGFTGERREERTDNLSTELRDDSETKSSDWAVTK